MGIYENLAELLGQQNETIFTRKEIIDLYCDKYPGTPRDSVIPSDFCYNRTNSDVKVRFEKNKKIFDYCARDEYKYLGENYLYTGDVCHKPQGMPEKVVGEWKNGKLTWF